MGPAVVEGFYCAVLLVWIADRLSRGRVGIIEAALRCDSSVVPRERSSE